jgi:hypothetical protein
MDDKFENFLNKLIRITLTTIFFYNNMMMYILKFYFLFSP